MRCIRSQRFSAVCRTVVCLVAAAGCEQAASESPQTTASNRSYATGHDWPNWRGPEHSGISRETGWQDTWPDGGPKQLWKASVGTGFSSVSIADGRLYTLGHRGDDDTVYCLDANTGEEIWKHSYPCKLVDNLHEGGPAATPTIHEGRVYTHSKEGHLFCFDAAQGAVLWSVKLQDLLGVEMPTWGFSCSPRVLGDSLLVEAGRTCALDRNTGELRWKTDKYEPGYGSPAILRRGEKLLVVVLNNEYLLIVDAADGKEVAKQAWETSFATSATTPIVDDDTIFISTGYNAGCVMFRLAPAAGSLPEKTEAGLVLERVYQNKNMSNHMANCVLYDNYLYGIDGNSHNRRNCELVCLDAASGDVKWKHRGLGCGSLMIADDKLIVLGDDGELVIAPANSQAFQPTAKARAIEGKCWTVPVLSHGRVYCRNADGDLVCVDLRP
ncbi:MAG: PQQ-binding-like beta-propeller repeat protein [Pirellulales bacterium]|nr:PQQ-binding-like beta-propeller repeat protein [Pirellulales bacterium]